MSQKKSITEIILHKDEPLARVLKRIEGNQKEIEEFLLNVDKVAVDIDAYDISVLTDINKGHWDIYRASAPTENSIEINLNSELQARSPVLDVQKDRVVAIDFGTKSTVAGYLDERSRKRLIRIGTGDIKNDHEQNDYENPTVVEFADIKSFFKAYDSVKSRPLTSWNDLRVSHAAANNLFEAKDEDFYRFFADLKQWANAFDLKIRIKDTKAVYDLKDFADCKDEDINPIELYAYFLARYINNMRNGIYLEYLLSFPVKYPKKVRDKIRESFERGIRKALPYAVLCDEDYAKQFKVEQTLSEPAAYAISALKEYGFEDEKYAEKNIYYGIFDFGGGTTDFDFGIWRKSSSKNYDFEIEHFGSGGDVNLGGEKLLELLAYEVFKHNKNLMREKDCSFTKPKGKDGFGADENLIATSQEARKNTAKLKEALRIFWENAELFMNEEENNASVEEKIQALKRGEITLNLVNNTKQSLSVNLEVDTKELLSILAKEIKRGVDSFYHCFLSTIDKMKGIDRLHIFLGGNSSRSVLVKLAFEELISRLKQENSNLNIELYPPLGSKEADEKKKELGLEASENDDFSTKITCKTGVVFGLLDGRKGSRIRVISEISHDDEAKFNFYLGCIRRGKFEVLLDKNELDIEDGVFHQLSELKEDEPPMDRFELAYTSNDRAVSSEGLLATDVTRLTFNFPEIKEGKLCVQITGTNSLKFLIMVNNNDEIIHEEEIKLTE
ncbi:hypothetical protein DMB92_04065 [Campylobacter sp. MIT 99-7217]|uniref:hypothetical protein n=1 Tax=Campylobacter sp. MIT 99-7217 TaxID=535091 RepID=UPI00115C186D|nr:hypothetical protein [Campylobacter sp. MIT 99-7217]TQR33140.1 hypothetical protein DMB92_04065 [Campylobacter sp. MIT 99-7217]